MASWCGTAKLWCGLLRAFLPHIGNKWIYDNRTTTNPHNPLYILHSCTECLSRTPGSHSVCVTELCSPVAQWQSTGGSSRRCPGLDSRQLPAFSLFLYFALFGVVCRPRWWEHTNADSWPRNLMLSRFHLQLYKGWKRFLGKNLFPSMDELPPPALLPKYASSNTKGYFLL